MGPSLFASLNIGSDEDDTQPVKKAKAQAEEEDDDEENDEEYEEPVKKSATRPGKKAGLAATPQSPRARYVSTVSALRGHSNKFLGVP